MNFTDSDLNQIKVKKQHLTEMEAAIKNIITTKKVSNISIGSLDYNKPTSDSYKKLQNAIHSLESSFSNNCCQACQSYTSCQSCQTCQSNCNCNCNCCDDGNSA